MSDSGYDSGNGYDDWLGEFHEESDYEDEIVEALVAASKLPIDCESTSKQYDSQAQTDSTENHNNILDQKKSSEGNPCITVSSQLGFGGPFQAYLTSTLNTCQPFNSLVLQSISAASNKRIMCPERDLVCMVIEMLLGHENDMYVITSPGDAVSFKLTHLATMIQLTGESGRSSKELLGMLNSFAELGSKILICRQFAYQSLEDHQSNPAKIMPLSHSILKRSESLNVNNSSLRGVLVSSYLELLAAVDSELLKIECEVKNSGFSSKHLVTNGPITYSLLMLFTRCKPWNNMFSIAKDIVLSIVATCNFDDDRFMTVVQRRILECCSSAKRLSLASSKSSIDLKKRSMSYEFSRINPSHDSAYQFLVETSRAVLSSLVSENAVLAIVPVANKPEYYLKQAQFHHSFVRQVYSDVTRRAEDLALLRRLSQQLIELRFQWATNNSLSMKNALATTFREGKYHVEYLNRLSNSAKGFIPSSSITKHRSLPTKTYFAAMSNSEVKSPNQWLHHKREFVGKKSSFVASSELVQHSTGIIHRPRMTIFSCIPENLQLDLSIRKPLKLQLYSISGSVANSLVDSYHIDKHFEFAWQVYLFGDLHPWQTIKEFFLTTWLQRHLPNSNDAKRDHDRSVELRRLFTSLSWHFMGRLDSIEDKSEVLKTSGVIATVSDSVNVSRTSTLCQQFTESLSLKLLFRLPVSSIITSMALSKYEDVFRILLRVQTLKWLGDACWHEGVSGRGSGMLALRGKAWSLCDENYPEICQQLMNCRAKLPTVLYFARAVHASIFSCVAEEWESFYSDKIQEIASAFAASGVGAVKGIRKHHEDFLFRVSDQITCYKNEANVLLELAEGAFEAFNSCVGTYRILIESLENSPAYALIKKHFLYQLAETSTALKRFDDARLLLVAQLIALLRAQHNVISVLSIESEYTFEVRRKLLTLIS